VDGKLVDINCTTDKYEICLRNAVLLRAANDSLPCSDCPFGLKFAGKSQQEFVDFLACFEGEMHANMSALPACAEGFPAVREVLHEAEVGCYDSPESRELLWAAENSRPFRKNLQHFPSVLINGILWESGEVHNATLRRAICSAYNGSSSACKSA